MPKIVLKDKSPEYADAHIEPNKVTCDMPNCPHHASHRAPKHRGLDEYYSFCVDHVGEYNKAWDFFSGMSNREVQDHVESSMYGDRPTWARAENITEDDLRAAAHNTQHFSDYDSHPHNERKHKFYGDRNTPEFEAMALMGLAPPVTLDEIKAQYKKLAKKHHPDLNRDNPDAEELLKKINMAYTILKLAFEEYKNLPDHKI